MTALGDWIRGAARAPRAHDADPAGGDPRRSASACAPTGGRAAGRRPATTPAPTTRSRSPCTRKAATAAPSFATPATGRRARRCSTPPPSTRPAAPAKAPRGSSSCCSAWRRSSSSTCSAGGSTAGRRPDRRLRRRRLPPLHPLDRRPVQRAAGDLHPAGRGAGLPLGERRSERTCAPWLLPGLPLRADRADPARVPAGRRRLRASWPRSGSAARAAGSPGLAGAALLVAALLLPIVPWTVRNAVVLDRIVPISTGGGKALYVGTFLPADGEYQRVKALLVERYLDRDLEPGSEALDGVDPTPLFDRVAGPLPRPAPRRGAGQDRQRELLRLPRRRPARLRGDDRAQGLADVERRHRRSDEQHRRPRRPGR